MNFIIFISLDVLQYILIRLQINETSPKDEIYQVSSVRVQSVRILIKSEPKNR